MSNVDESYVDRMRAMLADNPAWTGTAMSSDTEVVRDLLAQAWREGAQTSMTAEYAVNPYETHMHDARINEALGGNLLMSAMNAYQRALALAAGDDLRDGYGRPLTRKTGGEWVNEIGDTPCPNDGEMTNRRCWKCGWVRAAGGTRNG